MFALHHIGYLVADLASAASDFVERLGYVVESPAIEDPRQTAVVQFLRLGGADHWLELITPDGPASKLTKALSRGGGLHHLCYEVADIGAAGARLRERNMLPLGGAQPAVAFSGRPVAWFMDRAGMLVELVEAGPGDLSLASLRRAITEQP